MSHNRLFLNEKLLVLRFRFELIRGFLGSFYYLFLCCLRREQRRVEVIGSLEIFTFENSES
jgi:hypothetical protein